MTNKKLMITANRKIVMIDTIYEEMEQRGHTVCKGIILQKTSKGWYSLLLEAYGMEVLDEITDNYHALDFLGLSPDVQSGLYTFAAKRQLFGIALRILMKYKLDCRLAATIYDTYKNDPLEKTVSTILDNPYQLFLDNTCTFSQADALYLRMGNPANSETRCRHAILAALKAAVENNGDNCIPRQNLHGAVQVLLRQTEGTIKDAPCPFTSSDITQAISRLKEQKLIEWDKVGDKNGIYLRDNILAERTVTWYLTELMSSGKSLTLSPAAVIQALAEYEADSGLVLDDEQRTAVCTAILEPVSILTGGPGTGKTQTLNSIRGTLLYLYPDVRIIGCAPTGKAAVRMAVASGLAAGTIHRTLHLTPENNWVDRASLQADYVIVDETTMVDTWLMSKLLYALDPSARLILVGDVDQLPSVGPGRVFGDLIESGVLPVTRLVKNHRQSGGGNIQSNSRAIIDQKPGQPIVWRQSTSADGDFYFIEQEDPMERLRVLKGAYRQGLASGLTCLEIVVLTPEHNGVLGTNNLNEVFQREFNLDTEHRIQAGTKEFRLGDPVRHTKNNYTLKVMNGETGVITEVEADTLVVKYGESRFVRYEMLEIKEELELAYAISIHQAQGSEWPIVLIPVSLPAAQPKHHLYRDLPRQAAGGHDRTDVRACQRSAAGDQAVLSTQRAHPDCGGAAGMAGGRGEYPSPSPGVCPPGDTGELTRELSLLDFYHEIIAEVQEYLEGLSAILVQTMGFYYQLCSFSTCCCLLYNTVFRVLKYAISVPFLGIANKGGLCRKFAHISAYHDEICMDTERSMYKII